MFGLKKIGTAVAFVALTSFGAVSAHAATFFPGEPVDNLVEGITTVLTNDETIDNARGSLVAGAAFSDTFSFVVGAAPSTPGDPHPVNYIFSVEQEVNPPSTTTFGISDLVFEVLQNGGLVNTNIFTNGLGQRTGSANVFFGPWNVGDVITWNVTGTVLAGGGGYTISATAAPVPLPASVLMLVGALAGLGFVGRMKKSRFAAA